MIYLSGIYIAVDSSNPHRFNKPTLGATYYWISGSVRFRAKTQNVWVLCNSVMMSVSIPNMTTHEKTLIGTNGTFSFRENKEHSGGHFHWDQKGCSLTSQANGSQPRVLQSKDTWVT